MSKGKLAKRRSDEAKSWKDTPGRHPWDPTLEDISACRLQGVSPHEDRSARIFLTDDDTLMVVSTQRENAARIVERLAKGNVNLKAKHLQRPDEETLHELISDLPSIPRLEAPSKRPRLPRKRED